jgi:hypothetical protein
MIPAVTSYFIYRFCQYIFKPPDLGHFHAAADIGFGYKRKTKQIEDDQSKSSKTNGIDMER